MKFTAIITTCLLVLLDLQACSGDQSSLLTEAKSYLYTAPVNKLDDPSSYKSVSLEITDTRTLAEASRWKLSSMNIGWNCMRLVANPLMRVTTNSMVILTGKSLLSSMLTIGVRRNPRLILSAAS
ncbi:MAG: hypothetical protein EOO20_22725 [Chryseobacterium sp.]|nr:MAG: hypothetical protein EOO20_22725 [Chryseobacterium sp.]